MTTHIDKLREDTSQSVANAFAQKQSVGALPFQLEDKRPEVLRQHKVQEMAGSSLKMRRLNAFQEAADGHLHRSQNTRNSKVEATRLATTPTVQTASSFAVIQRAVILLDVNENDYALHKVLTGLEPNKLETLRDTEDVKWFGEERKKDPSRRAMVPYKNMETVSKFINSRKSLLSSKYKDEAPTVSPVEDIHVVGHGRDDRVWTSPQHGGEVTDFSNLGKWLRWVTPKDWTGTTRLLTCNSEREGQPRAGTVTGLLEAAIGDNSSVTGQKGFAYGMGKGHPIRVLKQEFEGLYKGDQYDEDIAKYLTDMAYRTPEAETAIGHKPDVNQRLNQGEWKNVWNLFVNKMNRIQTDMQKEVTKTPGESTLVKARSLEQNDTFQGLVREQDKLFSAFKLWR